MREQRHPLPQLQSTFFLTDGGLETTLVFHKGIDLPHFAAFVLLDDENGRAAMRDYYRTYLDLASAAGHGFVLETPTWRANGDWGAKLGFDTRGLVDINSRALEFIADLRNEYAGSGVPIVLSGNIGPRGDGYTADDRMSAEAACEYHCPQVFTFAECGADVVTAMTLTYPAEAIGIVEAAKKAGLPSVIGFTTETDGRLPNGQTLRSAIEEVDAASGGGPSYYMVNCAHIEHFNDALEDDQSWTRRIAAVRANASRLSHAELDECEHLDDGNPEEFGELCLALKQRFPGISVFGGCCGTDHRHIEAAIRRVA